MKKIAILLILSFVVCAVSGCVKTPENDTVTGKNKKDASHIENVRENTPQELGQPEHMSDRFGVKVGEFMVPFTVKVDADVSIPESSIFPVYSVKKASLIDSETAAKIIEYLFRNCDAYDAKNSLVDDVEEKCRLTRAMISMKQDAIKKALNADNPEHADYLQTYGRELFDARVELLRNKISNLDYFPTVESIDRLGFSKYNPTLHDSIFWSVIADVGGSEYRRINIVQGLGNEYYEYLMYDAGRQLPISYNDMDNIGCAEYLYDDYAAQPCGISVEDAEKYADEFMHATGLDKKFEKVYSGSTRAVNPFAFSNSYVERRAFVYVPKLNDTHLAYIAIDQMLGLTYARLLTPESMIEVDSLYYPNAMKIYVDSQGIERIQWRSCVPDEITDTVSENAKLMQFEDIYKIFKDKVGVQGNNMYFSGKEEHLPEESSINIKRIELSYYRVKSGTGAEDYALIPVWVFYGNTELRYKSQTDSEYQASKDGTCILGGEGYAFMIINAMDGSIIDFSRGY